MDIAVIRKVLAVLIAGSFAIYVFCRFAFTDYAVGASGYPWWVELFFGLVIAYGISRWDGNMLMELGGERLVPRFVPAFESLGVIFGVGCLVIGVTFVCLYNSSPN